MKPYLSLYDVEKKTIFKKEFETEFDRDKFARKLEFSKRLVIIGRDDDGYTS